MKVRDNPRYHTDGRVHITAVLDAQAALKNLSASGLCVHFDTFITVAPNEKYTVDIQPEDEAHIESFKLDVESKWVRANIDHSESGFVIVVPAGTPGEVLLSQYLEFLARYSKEEE